VRELRVRVPSELAADASETDAGGLGGGSGAASRGRLPFRRLRSHAKALSGWNCDGEFIAEPNVDIKYVTSGGPLNEKLSHCCHPIAPYF